jgi:hypothetical protein
LLEHGLDGAGEALRILVDEASKVTVHVPDKRASDLGLRAG